MTGRDAHVFVPDFAAAALVRRDPALRGRPVAALASAPAARPVVAATPEARARGVRPGMSAATAAACAPGLVTCARDPAAERSAAGALLDLAGAVSPRVEAAAPDGVSLDLAGLAALLGDEARIAARLEAAAARVDLLVRIGVADTRTAAALAARAAPAGAPVTRLPPGGAAAGLGPLPLGLLAPPPDLALALERWGIRSLGALAALPRAAVLARLGAAGAELQRRARGEDAGPFVPHVPAEPCVEALTLDWEVTALAGLGFVLHRLLERLAARLAARQCGAAALGLAVDLADGGRAARRVALPGPLSAPRTWGQLLLAACEGWTLPAPIVALAVDVEPAPLGALQADFFAPTRPSPRELGETLGRLAALVGPERVGAPVCPDTHRPDAIGLGPFPGPPAPPVTVTGAALVCRRLAPPRPAAVTAPGGVPSHVDAAGLRGPVVSRAGPWSSAGAWWGEAPWAREEWDVGLADGTACRLVRDCATGAWTVDAVYD